MPVMLGASRRSGWLLAAALAALLLLGALCLLDHDRSEGDLCAVLVVLTASLVPAIVLELAGKLEPALASTYHLTLADLRSLPPRP